MECEGDEEEGKEEKIGVLCVSTEGRKDTEALRSREATVKLEMTVLVKTGHIDCVLGRAKHGGRHMGRLV